ncbi:hypothetical protein [Streptomyces regalis]|uniref:Amidase domain-containing protein n=1 Tax=Streptomyces regalis TaxID=68262 RepID=A0A101JUA4_9ACTN|nr:hypothetical protein [Streptomyces regalis]KUL33223.1 hypothetical protein ADL12_22160 [Streptomyces regalis]
MGRPTTTAASATRAPPRATKLADSRVTVRAEDPSRPVGSDVAAAVDDVLTVLRAAVADVSGGPATAIPVRRGRSGLPIGLQAMGPSRGDLTTIEFAALLGREVDGFVSPPDFVQT